MKNSFLYFYQMFSTSVKFPCLTIYTWFAIADGEQSTSSEQGQTTSQASAPPAGKHYKMLQNQKESFLPWVGVIINVKNKVNFIFDINYDFLQIVRI